MDEREDFTYGILPELPGMALEIVLGVDKLEAHRNQV
jgi:hypothetical protein